MSIADKISRLAAAKTAIANAITGKGGTVGSGDGFEDFATDIATIPTGGSAQSSKSYTVSASGSQTISPDTGYDSMEEVALSVPSGSFAEITVSDAGLIKSGVGTAGWFPTNTSASKQLDTVSETTYNVSSSNQTIARGKYLAGKQTIRAVTTSNITAGNIKSGVTVKVGDAGDAGRIKNITGTYTGSSYTLLGSSDFTVSTTSTTATSTGTISLDSSAYTSAKIIYIKVRDKAGARNGYFVGSDTYIFNPYPANGESTAFSSAARNIHRRSSSGGYQTYTAGSTTGYGVYGYQVSTAGVVSVYQRYSSTYSLTINGTYRVEVYALDYAPSTGNPYDYSFS